MNWKLVLRDSKQLNAGQQLYVKDFIENLVESLIEDIPAEKLHYFIKHEDGTGTWHNLTKQQLRERWL